MGETWVLGQLAKGHQAVGSVNESLACLEEALNMTNDRAERWWEAELYRLRGEDILSRSLRAKRSRGGQLFLTVS